MDYYRVIVAGGRDFNQYDLLKNTLDGIFRHVDEPIMIVSGGAAGADRLGEKYAREHNLSIDHHPAQWVKYGPIAGFIRNQEMAECADALIAFWNGKSRGTKDMIDKAKKNKLNIDIAYY